MFQLYRLENYTDCFSVYKDLIKNTQVNVECFCFCEQIYSLCRVYFWNDETNLLIVYSAVKKFK